MTFQPNDQLPKTESQSIRERLSSLNKAIRSHYGELVSLEAEFHSLQSRLHHLQREKILSSKPVVKTRKKNSNLSFSEQLQKEYNLSEAQLQIVLAGIDKAKGEGK